MLTKKNIDINVHLEFSFLNQMFLLMNFIKVSEYRWKFHKSRRDNKNPCWNKTRAIIKSSQPWKGGKLGWPSRGFVQRGQLWKPEKYSRTFRIAGGPDCSCLQRKQFSFKHSGGIASISTEKNLLFLWIVLPGNQNKKQRQCDLPMIHFKFLWYYYSHEVKWVIGLLPVYFAAPGFRKYLLEVYFPSA